MPTVWLICPDAVLRERLLRCLRDGEQVTVCVKPCVADAVVVVPPVFTQAQVETLQAYVDTGSVREAARRRGCSEQTVRRHLVAARARVGAQNVAQLVHVAWVLGVLTAPYSTNWVQKWQKLTIDTGGGGQSRIEVENSQRRRSIKMRQTKAMLWTALVILVMVVCAVTATSVLTGEVMACPDDAGCYGDVLVAPLEASYIPPQEGAPPARVLYEYRCSSQHVAKCSSQGCTNGLGWVGGTAYASKKFVSDNVPYPRCIPTGEAKDKCYYFPQQCGSFYYYLLSNCILQVYSKPGYLEKCS